MAAGSLVREKSNASTSSTKSTTSSTSSGSSIELPNKDVDNDCATNSNNNIQDYSNQQLVEQLTNAVRDEKHILVLHLLQEMEGRDDGSLLPPNYVSLQKRSQQDHDLIQDLMNNEHHGGWTKQGLTHNGTYTTMNYHKLNEKKEVTVRLETPIDASLLVPLLAIQNETQLFTKWLPSFQKPFKLGISESGKLRQISRGTQLAQIKVDMPWPFSNREVLIQSAVTDAVEELGVILVHVASVEGEQVDGFKIPHCEKGWQRIYMNASLSFRPCPKDHPALAQSSPGGSNNNLLLATFTLFVSPSVNNLILRTVSPRMWAALLSVAEQVRDGKRPQHALAIQEQPEIYQWVEALVEKMHQLLK